MKSHVNEWVDQFPNFHQLDESQQIVRLVYFHTVEQKGETVSKSELEQLFNFIDTPVPDSLGQKLAYLCGKGARLVAKNGEYSVRREIRQSIEKDLEEITGRRSPPKIGPVPAFDFPGKTFTDKKVETLLSEAKRCYATECWNACGILMRIILERTLDSADPRIKAASGLKDKLNVGISTGGTFSKTIVDALKELKNAKLIGDIVAHHSTIVLDKPDVDLVVPSLRILIKEVTTI
jgi:hypothetical protein